MNYPGLMTYPSDVRVTLGLEDIPKKWYNIAADLPEPLPPPLNPGTKEPIKFEEMRAIFPDEITRRSLTSVGMSM